MVSRHELVYVQIEGFFLVAYYYRRSMWVDAIVNFLPWAVVVGVEMLNYRQ